MNTKTKSKGGARDRIIQGAFDLFYEQGYQNTTIDQIIERSGVSRPTVYSHFSTKEELCVAYLQSRRQRDIGALKDSVRKQKSAEERFMEPVRFIGKTILVTNYRGCGYFNMISEVPDPANPIVKTARGFVDALREVIRDGVLELKASDVKYKKLDAEGTAEAYYLIVGGMIMGCQEYRERWPIDRAIKEVERFIL